MQFENLNIEKIRIEGCNIYFEISTGFAKAKLRIYFHYEKVRKGQDERLNADTLYFEGIPLYGSETTGTVKVEYLTDLLIFAERRIQWLLEKAFRELKIERSNRLIKETGISEKIN